MLCYHMIQTLQEAERKKLAETVELTGGIPCFK